MNETSKPSNRDLIILEWPKRVEDPAILPLSLRNPYLDWTGGSLIGCYAVYIPKQTRQRRSLPCLLACRGSRFLVLLEGHDSLIRHAFDAQDISALRWSRILLDCGLEFHYCMDNADRSVFIPFNRAQEKLFLPFINTATGNAPDFECTEAEAAHPRPRMLKEQNVALYNYSVDGYRMGPDLDSYEYFELALKRHLLGPVPKGQVLLASCQKGSFLVEFYPGNQEIQMHFLPRAHASVQKGKSVYTVQLDHAAKAYLTLRSKNDPS